MNSFYIYSYIDIYFLPFFLLFIRAIDHDTAKQFADQNKLKYFETSAKDGTNVNEAFMALTQQIVDQKYVSLLAL